MRARVARAVAASLGAVLLLAGCVLGSDSNHDGEAFLYDETGEQGLRVVVRNPDGVRLEDGVLEAVYGFDTQWVERERQCYVASDGGFSVLRPDGEVVVQHDFADRPVCEHERITLGADGELVWSQ